CQGVKGGECRRAATGIESREREIVKAYLDESPGNGRVAVASQPGFEALTQFGELIMAVRQIGQVADKGGFHADGFSLALGTYRSIINAARQLEQALAEFAELLHQSFQRKLA